MSSSNELYFKKKEQLNATTAKVTVANFPVEIEKKRNRSNSPSARVLSVLPAEKGKIAYKKDIEDLKKEIDTKQEVLTQDIKDKLENVKQQLENMRKSAECTKNERLKQIVDECVDQTNQNVHSISSEMVKHLDDINVLKSKVADMEDLF